MHRRIRLTGMVTIALLLGVSTGCGGEEVKTEPKPAPEEPKPEPKPEPAPQETWCCVYDGADAAKMHVLVSAKECTEKYADKNGEYVKVDACKDAKAPDTKAADTKAADPKAAGHADHAAPKPAPSTKGKGSTRGGTTAPNPRGGTAAPNPRGGKTATPNPRGGTAAPNPRGGKTTTPNPRGK